MSDFTLESLGLKGNYIVIINYTGSNENHSDFVEFLNRHKNLKHETTENCSPKIEKESSTNVLPSIPSKDFSKCLPVAIKLDEISYEIFSQSKESIPARKISSGCLVLFYFLADVPDSFFDLSKEELLGYQRGLQNNSKSINFFASKTKTKIETSLSSRVVPIKLVFNNQIIVQAEFSLNWSGKLINFEHIL
jgi:hypothetical protein